MIISWFTLQRCSLFWQWHLTLVVGGYPFVSHHDATLMLGVSCCAPQPDGFRYRGLSHTALCCGDVVDSARRWGGTPGQGNRRRREGQDQRVDVSLRSRRSCDAYGKDRTVVIGVWLPSSHHDATLMLGVLWCAPGPDVFWYGDLYVGSCFCILSFPHRDATVLIGGCLSSLNHDATLMLGVFCCAPGPDVFWYRDLNQIKKICCDIEA